MAILHARLKLPVLDRLDGFFVQAHPQTAEDVDLAGATIDSDDHAERTHALILRFAGFFRELRIGLINRHRRRDAAAHMENSSTRSAALAGAKARPLA